jgi:predicted TIM-barrel fold metal-dependent hydrolase
MAERMGEFGIDFMMMYPTSGLLTMHLPEDDMRRAACRGMNQYIAEVYKGHEKVMCPVAVIPMHTPQEAIEELDYVTGTLGFRAAVFAGHVRRPVPAAKELRGAAGYAFWIDCYGVDSEHDYDPVWKRCMELKIVPSFHSSGIAWTARRSISNHAYNHIGHFASAGDALCKSLLMGGVTRRFPDLKFAFLEGGVSWATALLCSTVEHWEKRNARDIMQFAPERMDLAKFTELFHRYAPPAMQKHAGEVKAALDRLGPGLDTPQTIDDFAAMGVNSKKDFIDRFIKPFAFGCEADDRLAATAFQPKLNPTGQPLRVLFSSDVSHWDMPDMTEVLEEAHELVEKGLLDHDQFRRFMFSNVAEMYTSVNPQFFKGTAVDAAVHQLAPQRSAA